MEASDREFGLEMLKIYNDWMIEEWCGAAPGRYIPLTLIPMWDPQLAVAEMERCAARGVTTFAFSENPEPIGLPTIHDPNGYWDPVMQAANDLEMVASMHVGSSSTNPKISSDSPFMANLTWGVVRTSVAMLSWIFSGMFQRYPKIKIALSEGEIGWIPYFLERAEQVLDKQRHWVSKGATFGDHAGAGAIDLDTLDIRQTFADHVYGCFIDDAHGIASIGEIPEDNIMCETDYPHSDSTWPNSIEVVKHRIGHLPRRSSTSCCAATPRSSTASRRPSRPRSSLPEPAPERSHRRRGAQRRDRHEIALDPDGVIRRARPEPQVERRGIGADRRVDEGTGGVAHDGDRAVVADRHGPRRADVVGAQRDAHGTCRRVLARDHREVGLELLVDAVGGRGGVDDDGRSGCLLGVDAVHARLVGEPTQPPRQRLRAQEGHVARVRVRVAQGRDDRGAALLVPPERITGRRGRLAAVRSALAALADDERGAVEDGSDVLEQLGDRPPRAGGTSASAPAARAALSSVPESVVIAASQSTAGSGGGTVRLRRRCRGAQPPRPAAGSCGPATPRAGRRTRSCRRCGPGSRRSSRPAARS